MEHLPTIVFARHSETLDWYVVEVLPGSESRFTARHIPAGDVQFTQRFPDFEPTHVHYKGHGYRRYGLAFLGEEYGTDYVFYGDAEGNYWLRPKDMFEGCLDNGTVRFRALA